MLKKILMLICIILSSFSLMSCKEKNTIPDSNDPNISVIASSNTDEGIIYKVDSYGVLFDLLLVTDSELSVLGCEQVEGLPFIIPSYIKGKPVTKICEYAFSDNQTLIESIVIPNTITYIGGFSFHKCRNLKSVELGNNVTTIDEGAFALCTSLNEINFPNSLNYIGDSTFNGTSIKELDIPNGVTFIGERAFSMCRELKRVTLPNSLNKVSRGMFDECISLEEVNFIDEDKALFSSMTIDYYAFRSCEKLEKIIIPSYVEYIGDNAFYGCNNLTIYCKSKKEDTNYSSFWNRKSTKEFFSVIWDYQGY